MTTRNAHIDLLNRRLAESLGYVCSGTYPRFQWKYAPNEPFIVYDRDDRTILRKTWADSPSVNGGSIGRAWLIAQWTISKAINNMGFAPRCDACEGRGKINEWGIADSRYWPICKACGGKGSVGAVRMVAARVAGYMPHFETAMKADRLPTEEINAQRIWEIRRQLAASIEHCPRSFENYMMEEAYGSISDEARDKEEWREKARGQYDDHVGAMGNCEPGKRDGYLSLPSTSRDILPGFGFGDI